MTALDRKARTAGLLYILMSLVAPLRLIYIPSTLFVSGNPGATAANMIVHETLFRWGMVGDLFVGTTLVFVVLALYRLLSSSGRSLATAMVVLGAVLPATIYFLNTANDAAALVLVRGAPFLDAFDTTQRHALAALFLRLHSEVVTAAEMLWGLWLVPLAILTWRCGFVPRILSVWLMLNGLAYIIQSVAGFAMASAPDLLETICFPLQLGEVAFMLWLLVFGAKRFPLRRTPAA
ncbi:MAG: DUF4386 domain-containing protein [Acidobacteriaceae bacterium]|nr:DUF4386 domain-containing protein [Acidobacteriaceae bacterium]